MVLLILTAVIAVGVLIAWRFPARAQRAVFGLIKTLRAVGGLFYIALGIVLVGTGITYLMVIGAAIILVAVLYIIFRGEQKGIEVIPR